MSTVEALLLSGFTGGFTIWVMQVLRERDRLRAEVARRRSES